VSRVLVCAATRAERDACRRGIDAAGAGHETLLTGVGPDRAARALAERLARGELPELVVSSGFAGAVGPAPELASWISAISVSEWNGVARSPVGGLALVLPSELRRCAVVSSRVLVTRGARSALAAGGPETTGDAPPVVVDMESAALARTAAGHGVAFAVVRLISDTPAHPLPAFLAPFTAALSATSVASRLALAGRGLSGALADPRGVVRLAREGAAWLRELETGWSRLSLPA
jgi:hypothetical protein